MNKHTPGPWNAAINMVYGNPPAFTPNICIQPVVMGSPVNRSIAKIPRSGLEYSEANALLIAAAPDLLDALESALMALSGYTHQNQITNKALAKGFEAIAKSKGETE